LQEDLGKANENESSFGNGLWNMGLVLDPLYETLVQFFFFSILILIPATREFLN